MTAHSRRTGSDCFASSQPARPTGRRRLTDLSHGSSEIYYTDGGGYWH